MARKKLSRAQQRSRLRKAKKATLARRQKTADWLNGVSVNLFYGAMGTFFLTQNTDKRANIVPFIMIAVSVVLHVLARRMAA